MVSAARRCIDTGAARVTFARTKIQPPRPRGDFVERRSMQVRLGAALRGQRLVLLSAPGGFGKTVLLAQEIAQLPVDYAVAWIAADHGDELHRLLECMLAALEPFDPPWRIAPEALLAAVGRDDLGEHRRAAAELINALDACEVVHGVIAFDDVHRVADAAFFRFLDLLLERLPRRWTMVLAARGEPPLAVLPRLRAAGEVEELRQLHLQFARDEARRLALGAGLAETLADRLFDRTHGWPAGLRIAIGALQGVSGPAGAERALRTGERPVFDFLVAEVVEQLPRALVDFLLAASVLPELSAERCAVVTGDLQAALRLDEIERLGLFVDVIEAAERTLRLHDLFRDALQARLQQVDPARLARLRRLAADTEPDPLRRITLLLETGAVDAAAELAFEHLPAAIATTGAATALHIVGLFPPQARDSLPGLAFVRALARWVHHWDFGALIEQMEQATAGFAARGQRAQEQLARAHWAIGLIGVGRLAEGEALLAQLRVGPLTTATRIEALYAEAWIAIDACRYGAVAGLMTKLLDLLQTTDRPDLWYHTTPPLRMPGLPGMTPVLERHAELLLRISGDAPIPLRAIGTELQAWCALWRGQPGEARRLMESASDDAHWSGQTSAVRAHLMSLSAVLAVVAGDRVAAVAAAESRRRAFIRADPWQRYLMSLFVARMAACGDHLEALHQVLPAVAADRPVDAPQLNRLRELPVNAQLAWLEGRSTDAMALWRECLDMEEATDLLGQASEVRVRLARARLRAGELPEAAPCLRPQVERARGDGPGGARRAGEALGEVAGARWGRALPPAQARELAAWWHVVAAERARNTAAQAAPPAARMEDLILTGSLTARELEVLARIAAGDSNKLIARAFDLSLHTVKRHVANILGKLALETRGQAAAWYRANAR
jgi:LuxR family maltose regulon positive regulatory protein